MTVPQWQQKVLFIRMMATDCELQAEEAKDKLEEVLDCLHEGDHLAALGASERLTEMIEYITTVLNRLASLTYDEPISRIN